jgi:hypothetical protein
MVSINSRASAGIFADVGAGEDVLATLPMGKGYTTEFLNFNIGSQQVKRLQLRVIPRQS